MSNSVSSRSLDDLILKQWIHDILLNWIELLSDVQCPLADNIFDLTSNPRIRAFKR